MSLQTCFIRSQQNNAHIPRFIRQKTLYQYLIVRSLYSRQPCALVFHPVVNKAVQQYQNRTMTWKTSRLIHAEKNENILSADDRNTSFDIRPQLLNYEENLCSVLKGEDMLWSKTKKLYLEEQHPNVDICAYILIYEDEILTSNKTNAKLQINISGANPYISVTADDHGELSRAIEFVKKEIKRIIETKKLFVEKVYIPQRDNPHVQFLRIMDLPLNRVVIPGALKELKAHLYVFEEDTNLYMYVITDNPRKQKRAVDLVTNKIKYIFTKNFQRTVSIPRNPHFLKYIGHNGENIVELLQELEPTVKVEFYDLNNQKPYFQLTSSMAEKSLSVVRAVRIVNQVVHSFTDEGITFLENKDKSRSKIQLNIVGYKKDRNQELHPKANSEHFFKVTTNDPDLLESAIKIIRQEIQNLIDNPKSKESSMETLTENITIPPVLVLSGDKFQTKILDTRKRVEQKLEHLNGSISYFDKANEDSYFQVTVKDAENLKDAVTLVKMDLRHMLITQLNNAKNNKHGKSKQ